MSESKQDSRFERDIQYVNFAFGSAFGAYVGIVLATKDLTELDVFTTMLLLWGVASWLIFYHDSAEKIIANGIRKHHWLPSLFLTQVVGLEVLASSVGKATSIAVHIFQAWTIGLVLVLGLKLLASRLNHD